MKRLMTVLLATAALTACASNGLDDKNSNLKSSAYTQVFAALPPSLINECNKASVSLNFEHDGGDPTITRGDFGPSQRGLMKSTPGIAFYTADTTLKYPNGHEAHVLTACAFSFDKTTLRPIEFKGKSEI